MPRDTVDQEVIRAFWDRKSREASNRWTPDEMLDFELGMLREIAPAPASILDLGSGHGELSRALAREQARLVAVDFAPAYRDSFDGPRHEFAQATVGDFRTTERFDLILLFGVVTCIDAADEPPLYRRMAGWLAPGGVAVVKNQCALEDEFVVAGWSEQLGAEYSGRYPPAAEQGARLGAAFESVAERPYPDQFNPWPNSAHVAFVCRGATGR